MYSVLWFDVLFLYINLFVVWSSFFFFFKQKTAYEMRISDGSSDVCSSDLAQTSEALGTFPSRIDDWAPCAHRMNKRRQAGGDRHPVHYVARLMTSFGSEMRMRRFAGQGEMT